MKARKWLLFVVLLLLAAGATAPFLSANGFHAPIQRALESALNRRVTLGKIHFNIFTGPGFAVDDVLIEEAPGNGIEPFAHVKSLEARLRFTSLFSGSLAFSNLKLVEPSINFVKFGNRPWNVQPLLNRAAAVPSASLSFPGIQIRQGRLDFKLDNTKSVLYMANADLDVYTNQDGNLVIRFSGEPLRTDRPAQAMAPLVARGVLRSKRHAEDELSMSVQLERTAISDLTRLFDVQDFGVRGMVASNLKLEGPLSNINISGDLRIEGIHRWDMMPNKGEGWTLNYTGFLNVPGQQVEIATRSADQQASPVNARFVASNYLTTPRWEASLSLVDVPAAGLVDTARNMGAPLPAGATLDASLNGDISYSQPDGVKGRFVLDHAAFKFPQGGATQFESAPVEILGNELKFGPAEITMDNGQSAQLQGTYAMSNRTLRLALETRALEIAQTRGLIQRLLGTAAVPLFDRCRQGAWKGTLAYEQKEDSAAWSGEFELQNTLLDVPGLQAPVRLSSAIVQIQPGQVQVSRARGHAGDLTFDGDYRYFIAADRPDRVRLNIGPLQLSDLEQLFLPTLNREQGFLARALRLQRVHIPEWLRSRSIEGIIQAKDVHAGDLDLGSLRAHLTWTGSSVQLTNLESKLDEMEGAGKLAINLTAAIPQYTLTGQLHGIEYHGGSLDIEGVLSSRGMGADLALNARSEGTFTGENIALASDAQCDEISGDYRVDPVLSGPRLSLSKVQLTQGQEILHGQGASQPDGRVVLELTSGRKQVRLSGMLLSAQ